MKDGNLFHHEEQVLARGQEFVDSPGIDGEKLRAEFSILLKEYAKLSRQTKSLVNISDMMQKDLNVLNEKLNDANNEINEKNQQLEEFSERLTQTLQFSQQKYRDLFENAVEGIFRISASGVIYEANMAYARIFGFDNPEEMVASVRNMGELYVDPRERDKLLERLRDEGYFQGVTLHLKRRDGSAFWASASARAVKNESGGIDFYEGLMADITQRVQVERAEREREAADAASQAKTRFLAKMSHEIRTPMNAILGMAEILLRTDLSRQQRDYLEVVHESGEHLLGVINDIMDFSKLESKKIILEKTDFSLKETVNTVLKSIEVLAAPKGLAVNLHMASNVPINLRGDPGRLRQVLNNLLGNAVKFTERGVVALAVTRAPNSKINECHDKSVELMFSVKDTGIGIPVKDQAKIFQDFAQSHDSIFRMYGGTGLGLSISRELVELMGGEIWLSSLQGKGSEFFFTCCFEIGESPRSVDGGMDRSCMLPHEGMNILIVEDSPSNFLVVRHHLENFGHHAFHAEDGLQALQKLSENDSYDIVLMDVELPTLNGVETAKRIRAGLDGVLNPEIPIVAMTAHALEEARLTCLEAGMNAYVSKPLRAEDLYKAMVEAFARACPPEKNDSNQLGGESRSTLDFSAAGAFQGLSVQEVKTLVPTAMTELRLGMQGLEKSFETDDILGVSRTAHTLKTVAASIGAGIMRQRLLDLEESASKGRMEQARQEYRQLKQDMERLEERIRELGLS